MSAFGHFYEHKQYAELIWSWGFFGLTNQCIDIYIWGTEPDIPDFWIGSCRENRRHFSISIFFGTFESLNSANNTIFVQGGL